MKILAVSGGIDSVVMLDFLYSTAENRNELIVAHFDHGIRKNSAEDCAFVRRLAEQKYHLEFVSERAELGERCSESVARRCRYDFLKRIAREHDGNIYVAHHADDVVESIVINLIRGTGWRGLAPMSQADVVRPLLDWSKAKIYRYATEHQLTFRQDPTNVEETYLRNRIRQKLRTLPNRSHQRILELYRRQFELRNEINAILAELAPRQSYYPRAVVANAPNDVAVEIVRHILGDRDIHLTRPQLQRCRDAIKDFTPGKYFSLDSKHLLKISKYSFSIESKT